ncbi:putative quinol monooxygenase [Haloarchaeobius amylolyticus]|uniref:putative quinol monooxygenase n=1 Tax=Haloarchaeobius amylolyticus TaxID=1198296 RepID=UPI00226FEE4C|nr:putative quinol monooxygenase [Haloarchaeobius amylolyticus]
MFVIQTTIPVDPAHRDEFVRLAEALVERSREQDGTVDYNAAADLTEPNTFRFFERYRDEAAVDAHARTEEYREFIEALPEVTDGKLRNVQFEVDEAPDEVEFEAEAAIPDEWE